MSSMFRFQVGVAVNLFEYLSIVMSIVLALGIARILTGLASFIRRGRMSLRDATTLGWPGFPLLMRLGWWFGLWANRGTMESIILVRFLAIFLWLAAARNQIG